jgi:hypothetical protein
MAIVIEFDRGTLLIRGLQNGGTTARLSVLWDPRVHAPEERQSYERWTKLYRKPFSDFRRLHPAGSWDSFVRMAACSEEGRRAIAAWTRARHLLAYPEAKKRLLGSLLERHRADRMNVFVGDNETAWRANTSSCPSPAISASRSGLLPLSASGAGFSGRSSRRGC